MTAPQIAESCNYIMILVILMEMNLMIGIRQDTRSYVVVVHSLTIRDQRAALAILRLVVLIRHICGAIEVGVFNVYS